MQSNHKENVLFNKTERKCFLMQMSTLNKNIFLSFKKLFLNDFRTTLEDSLI